MALSKKADSRTNRYAAITITLTIAVATVLVLLNALFSDSIVEMETRAMLVIGVTAVAFAVVVFMLPLLVAKTPRQYMKAFFVTILAMAVIAGLVFAAIRAMYAIVGMFV